MHYFRFPPSTAENGRSCTSDTSLNSTYKTFRIPQPRTGDEKKSRRFLLHPPLTRERSTFNIFSSYTPFEREGLKRNFEGEL